MHTSYYKEERGREGEERKRKERRKGKNEKKNEKKNREKDDRQVQLE